MAFYTTEPVEQLRVFDFVTVKGGSSTNQYHSANARKQIAITETAKIISDHISQFGPIKLVLLEVPHSMPNDGHVGAFKFGKACGILDGILGTLDLTVVPANPGAWKSALGLSSNKQKSIIKAIATFGPHFAHYFSESKNHDRAEAALLAWHCHKIFGGG